MRHSTVAVSALLLLPSIAASSPRRVDLRTEPAEVTVYARGDTAAGFFADRLSAPAAPADLSGDGRPDLILSAWTGDGPPSVMRADAGEVHVRFGPLVVGVNLDLASVLPDVSIYGARADDFLYAAAAADVSGDGQPDLILAAPRANGPGGTRPNGGTAYVLFGPFARGTVIDLALTAADVTIHAARAQDDLNARDPFDANGDGHLDLLLTASYGDGPAMARPNAGEALVLAGPFRSGTVIDLATASPLLRAWAPSAFDVLSWAVGGDFDGDGRADLALGLFGSSGRGDLEPYAGEVRVLFGPLAGNHDLATSTGLVIWGDDIEDSLGGIIASGDLDGNGLDDLLIGACCSAGPGETRPYSGEIDVFFAPLPRGERWASEADVRVLGASSDDSLRYPVTGRLNADDCLDLVAGADFASGPGKARPGAGEAYVLTGPFVRGQVVDLADGLADLTVYGAEVGTGAWPDLLGIVATGDLTGDGRSDLLASAQLADGPGNARPDSGEVYLLEGGCRHLDVAMPEVTRSEESIACLWPPNHRFACFTRADFHPEITVPCAQAWTWRIAACDSDQDDSGGGGDDGADCLVSSDGEEVCARAERRGGGPGSEDGRRYFVSIIATDACGNDGPPEVIATIEVPHDEPPPGKCRMGSR